MAKEELLEFEGIVLEALPEARFRVRLDNDHAVSYTHLTLPTNREV